MMPRLWATPIFPGRWTFSWSCPCPCLLGPRAFDHPYTSWNAWGQPDYAPGSLSLSRLL